ncbi:ATP-binding cassette sub-family A member 5-like isoform X2 [Apis dorsata]|uniref:ATP-binding cassette sub-family A member 5-like isoform X2 n=1 Tax=Apis dorsata TaxID=7462 RepID=UPI001292F5E9|nr:ATP-binding cassette sub-family A member 5-like isoform X2 [Apis dorsata]
MGTCGVYLSQLRAMLVRNLLLKKREKRKTTAEIFLPLCTLGVLIVVKVLPPNPNYPAMTTQRQEGGIFETFNGYKNNTIAVVPNSTETLAFLNSMNALWLSMWDYPGKLPLNFMVFDTKDDLQAAYWRDPYSVPLAVIFEDSQPISQHLLYEIRTNPSYTNPPSPTELYSAPVTCRKDTSHWLGGVLSIETGGSCPANNYLHSGFLALQMIMDITKIRLDTRNTDITVPDIKLEMFPKEAFTADWMLAFRVVIPLFMVLAISQFVTYLLILIVGEKEKKIKEGMKIMGLKDSIFWLSWFIIYSVFVLLLSAVGVILLFTLQMFQHTHFLPIFLLVVLYSFSIIMLAFMITPFFDKSRTAGVLGNFAVTIMSLMYFIQVFVNDSSSVPFWLVSLLSPTGVALAMDKALVLDLQGEGVNFDNLWSGPGIPFGGSLIMMTLDIILYACLAYYFDCVIPSEYGTKRTPWFCFTPEFWCQRKAPRVPSSNGESNSFIPGEETNRDVEPVVREMKGREAIRIVDLYKSYQKCRKPEIKAVNGINLTIYEGQITAILGHNGAGKTSLFNILTGLTAPTAGTALIFGYDVRDSNDMQMIRSMTGVCPQHDILFDLLTPREHLEFFAAVRGIPRSMIEHEVNKTLKDIDLTEKADTFAKYLSGGLKRKLSVGIAIIGDPKIIILDEPTAGVDPYSRRQMWSFLQSRRHGKVILLTTHFMDEADILADRKAVISKGKLRCCGSSLFLKNKFGIGYHLTLVLEGNAREHAITRLVMSHVSKAEKARRHGRELSFILPHNSVESFASLFSAIEHEIKIRSSRLGISSYGVSMTTLEEVFLHLEKDEGPEYTMDNLSKKMVRNRALSRSLSLQSKSTSYQSLQNEGVTVQNDGQAKEAGDLPDGVHSDRNPPVLGLGLDPIKIRPNFIQTLYAMLRLRILRLFRNIQLLYFTIVAPLFLIVLGLHLHSIQTVEVKMQSLKLNNDTYGNQTKILYTNSTDHDITDLIDGIGQDVKYIKEYHGNFANLLKIAPHVAAFNINEYSLSRINLIIAYNDTMQHSLPILINLLSNTYYRLISDKDNLTHIEVKTHPFQQTSQPQEFNIGTASSALFIGMHFILLPITLVVDMVYDRERNGGSIGEEIMENSDIGEHEDGDVKIERQKVFNLITSSSVQEPPVVLVQNLRKEYRQKESGSCSCCSKQDEEANQIQRKVAVRNLSLAVEPGEVFGLLGHNGAGKTTTMKIIIAEEAATRGRVQIGGHNINSSITEAFKQMGYCPQHDAQWKNITVREHLECYAAIRGVPWGDIDRIVDLYLTGLQIHEHADKQTQECSGGTRRKLSFAMAMIGGPKVVLMDEPSAGMDPRSKRFLWDTILASFQGGRGAILTTHSMEEADALCSRVGIMVKGELRCIGSTQHLKNLYGAGYTLEMKLLGGDCTPTTPSGDRITSLKEFVSSLFPDATLEESFADRLVFAVPQHAVNSLAECFMQLEKAKLELDIEEYSFSQTTLEQVFLKFSHYDESNSGE